MHFLFSIDSLMYQDWFLYIRPMIMDDVGAVSLLDATGRPFDFWSSSGFLSALEAGNLGWIMECGMPKTMIPLPERRSDTEIWCDFQVKPHGVVKNIFDTKVSHRICEKYMIAPGRVFASSIELVGFALVMPVLEEAEVLTWGIRPCWRRRGLGRVFFFWVLQRLISQQISSVFLEVRASNLSALSVYNFLGFRCVGKRVGYYPSCEIEGKTEDALILLKKLEVSSFD